MESVLTAFIIVFVVLFAVLTLSHTFVDSQDLLRTSWEAMAARIDAQARTQLTATGGEVMADGATVEVTLRNGGATRLADFDALDVVIEYQDGADPAGYYVDWLPYTEGIPTSNQWMVAGIYQDSERALVEVFERGILNPGEAVTLQLVVSPAVGPGKAVQVSVATPNGVSTSTTFTRNLPPELVTNAGVTVINGRTVAISRDELAVDDADDPPEALIYSVMTPPAQGSLNLGAIFTQEDIDNGLLFYSHNGSGPDSFEFNVSDGVDLIGQYTFDISVDFPPMLVANTGIQITPGGTVLINGVLLEAIDSDNAPGELVYTVTTPPVRGALSLGESFTQAEINGNLLSYTHSLDGPDGFQFTVSDGVAVIGAYTFAITY